MKVVTLLLGRITIVAGLLLSIGLVRMPGQQHFLRRNYLLNGDIVTLAKAGFTERAIIDSIREQPSRFDVTVAALAKLSAQGISQQVVRAMVMAKACGTSSDLPRASRCAKENEVQK